MDIVFQVKEVEGKVGGEFTATYYKDGMEYTSAIHYYDRTEIDDEVKLILTKAINKLIK